MFSLIQSYIFIILLDMSFLVFSFSVIIFDEVILDHIHLQLNLILESGEEVVYDFHTMQVLPNFS